MSRDDAHILDILNAARTALSFVRDVERDAFDQDEKTQSAVLYQLTILGEAAKRVSEGFKQAHLEVPWRKMAGTRDRVVHDYDRVSLDKVWEVLQNDLPALVATLEPLEPKRP
ncbi:MAG: hypothetical protein A3I61_07770 [Acidobacteria bacterium RIFCSPLOWO2_02_FULL_68_18]|nr:MAG: hypothetical protein A3I61_07770 [Acidobacteria bacterium RIFCSPLOWO2_02_FULL_68_18]OFW50851.1 MAG: hypothetical protein A3G77_16835 [Acidobacteria bacterium RIFCSPLOWO2_12_FULL_68_19]